MTVQQLLEVTIANNASDLHLVVGFPPVVRVNGELFPVRGYDELTPEQFDSLIIPLLTANQKSIFETERELDFSFQFQDKGRFRTNIYYQKGYQAAAMRYIPVEIKELSELGFPPVAEKLADLKQGFVLVTGPTGHGKSTTLAAFINHINNTQAAHIITIEDPVEYVYPAGKSLITQREMNSDTRSWGTALRSVLREDPDIVLIGEMRDLSTIAAAMTIAETGHLVFATLHTNSAAQSVDRIIDVFPESQQPQIRLQLASTLEAILSLRLVPTIQPGRTIATEVLLNTPAVSTMIREGKTHLIDNVIYTSGELGMMSLEVSLANLVKSGKILPEQALKFSLRPEVLTDLLK